MSETEQNAPAEVGATGKPWLKKAKVAGLVATIVIVQLVVISVFLPLGDEPAAHASSPRAASHEPEHHHETASEEQTEVDLGAFSLTVFNPNTNSNFLVDFHLFATVAGTAGAAAQGGDGGHGGHGGGHSESTATGDAAKLESLMKKNKHRFRDQIIVTIRNAQIADLADPGLGLIKRQILTKTNALLGESLLKEVVFSDFVVVEQ